MDPSAVNLSELTDDQLSTLLYYVMKLEAKELEKLRNKIVSEDERRVDLIARGRLIAYESTMADEEMKIKLITEKINDHIQNTPAVKGFGKRYIPVRLAKIVEIFKEYFPEISENHYNYWLDRVRINKVNKPFDLDRFSVDLYSVDIPVPVIAIGPPSSPFGTYEYIDWEGKKFWIRPIDICMIRADGDDAEFYYYPQSYGRDCRFSW